MIYLDCRVNELQGFPGGSVVKNLPAQQEAQKTWVRSLKQENLLKEEMATHSIIVAWEIPWTEEPGGLQFMRPQRVRHDWAHTRKAICNMDFINIVSDLM